MGLFCKYLEICVHANGSATFSLQLASLKNKYICIYAKYISLLWSIPLRQVYTVVYTANSAQSHAFSPMNLRRRNKMFVQLQMQWEE